MQVGVKHTSLLYRYQLEDPKLAISMKPSNKLESQESESRDLLGMVVGRRDVQFVCMSLINKPMGTPS